MKPPRVLLGDDHTIFVEGLRRILEPHFEIIGTVPDGRALVAAARELKPDVIVADVSMPLLNGIEAARQIKKEDPHSKIVILTMHADATYGTEAFQAGATGFVLKNSAPSEIVTAIQEALKGRVYVTPLIAGEVLHTLMEHSQRPEKRPLELTARQREVLQLVAEGRSAKEIASILRISPRTVEFHKYRIMEELGLRTTAELTQYAIKHKIVAV